MEVAGISGGQIYFFRISLGGTQAMIFSITSFSNPLKMGSLDILGIYTVSHHSGRFAHCRERLRYFPRLRDSPQGAGGESRNLGKRL